MFRSSVYVALIAASALLTFVGCGGENGYPVSDRTPASVAPDSYDGDSAIRSEAGSAEFATDVETFATEPTAPAAGKSFADDAAGSSAMAADATVAPGGGFGESEALAREEVPFEPRSGRQSGVLTAGSFDDVDNFAEYLSFLRRNPHQVSKCRLPMPTNARQTVITVTDGQNRPVGFARCVVKCANASQQETVLLDMRTGTDGRVMLLSPTPSVQSQQNPQLHLQVFVDGQDNPVIDEYREPQTHWQVAVQAAESTLPSQLDLALVIDTTGSMSDELEYLKTEIDSIVASVKKMFPDIDQRFALITYRDNGDQYVCRNFDFTGSLSDFRRKLDAESAHGGGDFPEAMDVALKSAEQLTWRDGNTARVMFLVGDAPPHQKDTATAMSAISGLRQRGVRIYPVGASGVEKTAEVVLRTASLLTMGQYLFLTDHSGVGNAHATPDVSEFAVERLDRLMIRMIASELAGKRLVPQEVIAIERGERYTCIPPVRQPVCLLPAYPMPQPEPFCCVIDSPPRSTITIVMEWFGHNALATILAVVSGAIVFDRLTSWFCSTPRRS